MEIIVSGRQTGKTTRLISMAAAHPGSLLVVHNIRQQEYIEKQIREMGANITVMNHSDVIRGRLRGRKFSAVYLDNADFFLRAFFPLTELAAIAMDGFTQTDER